MRPLALPLIPTLYALGACAAASSSASAPGTPAAGVRDGAVSAVAPPALEAIKADELRRDLFALAGDEMRGREAGTLDEMRATVWIAERAREAGLEPAGDDGTYFQFWPMRRVRVSPRSKITLGGRALALGTEAVVVNRVQASVNAPLVFAGEGKDADLTGRDLGGKVVAVVLSPPNNPPAANVSLREYRYALAAIRQRSAALAQRGASAIVLVSDSIADTQFGFVGSVLARGNYGIDSAGADQLPAGAPVIWVRGALLDRVRADTGKTLAAEIAVESFVYPSVNVIARVRGTDIALRDEHVLFSGHQDHDGVRFPTARDPEGTLRAPDVDSIWNGADDNATVSVALLAIGRAFARQPGRRSALFVWHGAEERGLLGSRWYSARPTVPKESIVAVLNGDMIGRNHPDSAALLGVTPPHRNSSALVALALAANDRVTRFSLDTTWDRPTHPEGWYFRSDHLPYARAGIPAIFFTTLLHPDYHTPRDEPSRIDISKLARMTRWMYATGWAVSATTARPMVDPGFKLER